MKRRRTTRLGVVALALTLITMTMTGGTLAKYTAEVTGDTTATVAKFAFDLNGASEQTEKKTINLSSMFSNTYNDEMVKAAEGKKVVAPGTSGKVKITLDNKGEVKIAPAFNISETNAQNIPLQYAITETEAVPVSDDEWKKSENLITTTDPVIVGSSKIFYLHWRWNPKSVDTADSTLGIKTSLDTVKIEISCTVSQVIPESQPTPGS